MDIKEILLLHHSHFDVGYTHTQQIVWELQKEFLDLALKLLDDTKDFPEYSRPKWTVEVTSQIMNWLETSSPEQVDKLKNYIAQGRIGFSGLRYNTTPLANAEGLARQLYDIKYINENLGTEVKTVNQHDVNGIPWSAVDLMLDSGIELFIMAVNQHLGGNVAKRPSVFRWQGPSGREILVMNGAHYTMFDQLLYSWENSIERMEEGLNEYYEHLKKVGYDLDFIYLTTAAAPVCWDNSPPNIDVAGLVTEWNKLDKNPLIRYITPNELLERIKSSPLDKYPVHKGDWTDYWNFGCASTGFQTKINQAAKSKIYKADFLNACAKQPNKKFKRISKEAWEKIHLFDEHTWGSYNSMDPDNEYSRIQFTVKDNYAYDAHELAEYLLVDQLEEITQNPENFDKHDGVFVFNPTSAERTEYLPVPDWWFDEGKRRRTARFGWQNRVEQINSAPLYGPVKLSPFGYSKIKLNELKKAEKDNSLKTGEFKVESKGRQLNVLDAVIEEFITKYVESEFYRIEFNPKNCRITRVYDKVNDWEILDTNSDYTFFQFVQETTDPLFREDRRAYYARSLDNEKFDITCWNTGWKRIRSTALKTLGYKIKENPTNIELELSFDVPGCDTFKQTFILHRHKAGIEIKIEIMKSDVRTPESIYFVTPLNLGKDWDCVFDTAGVSTRLDDEQLPGSSKDWFTVEKFVTVYNKNKCAALFCPDAPMIQAGDFNFGKRSKTIERNEKPLLAAWSLNNYWDTNFRPTQPGFISLTYFFKTYAGYNETKVSTDADEVFCPVETYPLLVLDKSASGSFLKTSGEGLKVLHIKKAENDSGIILRVINLDESVSNYTIEFPGGKVKEAFETNTFEDIVSPLQINDTAVTVDLQYKKITTLLVRL
ncbi:MAG: hypothetical protein PVH88_06945 [Ignavibacteria bacterium]|jgi:hypothetical protein